MSEGPEKYFLFPEMNNLLRIVVVAAISTVAFAVDGFLGPSALFVVGTVTMFYCFFLIIVLVVRVFNPDF